MRCRKPCLQREGEGAGQQLHCWVVGLRPTPSAARAGAPYPWRRGLQPRRAAAARLTLPRARGIGSTACARPRRGRGYTMARIIFAPPYGICGRLRGPRAMCGAIRAKAVFVLGHSDPCSPSNFRGI